MATKINPFHELNTFACHLDVRYTVFCKHFKGISESRKRMFHLISLIICVNVMGKAHGR